MSQRKTISEEQHRALAAALQRVTEALDGVLEAGSDVLYAGEVDGICKLRQWAGPLVKLRNRLDGEWCVTHAEQCSPYHGQPPAVPGMAATELERALEQKQPEQGSDGGRP